VSLEAALHANLRAVHDRITKAARGAGRDPDAVSLLAVSKTFPAESVLAAVRFGQRAFGENYVQEALDKMERVQVAGAQGVEWHFIGPIQSNKTRAIAEHFDWVQSVDRFKIAQRLSEQRPAAMGRINVLLQVNISGEASKSGVAPADVPALARGVADLPGLALRGLMAIPEPETDPARQRTPLTAMRTLFDRLRNDGFALDTLSMGMSADLETAIMEGSTMVRIGTALFGERASRQA
jgi:PLP dependent protein